MPANFFWNLFVTAISNIQIHSPKDLGKAKRSPNLDDGNDTWALSSSQSLDIDGSRGIWWWGHRLSPETKFSWANSFQHGNNLAPEKPVAYIMDSANVYGLNHVKPQNLPLFGQMGRLCSWRATGCDASNIHLQLHRAKRYKKHSYINIFIHRKQQWLQCTKIYSQKATMITMY